MAERKRSLDDPEVWEDVQFLIEHKRPNEEIARRCNVGLHALRKRVGTRAGVV